MVIKFLRHNSRHHIYWCTRGKYSHLGPRLNPVDGMVFGGDNKSISLYEPRWLFRLRQRIFAHAGRQRCGRRNDPFLFNRGDGPLPDTWDWGPDGCRTCSYCGSAHPDDLMRICRLAATDERYGVSGTDKRYKVYLRQPGVRNASEGAIKFYMHHAPETPTDEEQEVFSTALRVTAARERSRWERMREART